MRIEIYRGDAIAIAHKIARAMRHNRSSCLSQLFRNILSLSIANNDESQEQERITHDSVTIA